MKNKVLVVSLVIVGVVLVGWFGYGEFQKRQSTALSGDGSQCVSQAESWLRSNQDKLPGIQVNVLVYEDLSGLSTFDFINGVAGLRITQDKLSANDFFAEYLEVVKQRCVVVFSEQSTLQELQDMISIISPFTIREMGGANQFVETDLTGEHIQETRLYVTPETADVSLIINFN
jgi:hypothetical protein